MNVSHLGRLAPIFDLTPAEFLQQALDSQPKGAVVVRLRRDTSDPAPRVLDKVAMDDPDLLPEREAQIEGP